MVLRKPYAFLIKYFKLIHAIMAACLFYLVYQTSTIMNFLNNYSDYQLEYIGSEISNNLFNLWVFFVPLLIIISSIVIMALMVYKKKPFKFYLINIAVCIATMVFYILTNNIVGTMEIRLVEIRTVLLYRDISLIVFGVQFLNTVILFARATGFDIKKFNFGQDLQELKIESEDREEVEVEVAFHGDHIRRDWRYTLRHLKYYYLENKFAINTIVLIIFCITAFTITLNLFVYNKTINEGVSFNADSVIMTINNSYVSAKNYKGNIVKDNKAYVVLSVNLERRYNNDTTLEIGRSAISINGKNYYPLYTNMNAFSDLGRMYLSENVSSESQKRLLVYEIPANLVNKNMTFVYYEKSNFGETSPQTIKVKLKPTNLDTNIKIEEYKRGEVIDLKETTLGEGKIQINNVSFSDYYYNLYDYCITPDDCFESIEMLKPNPLSTTPLGLIAIDGIFEGNKNIEEIISTYASISYEIDGKTYLASNLKNVVSKHEDSNYTYYEVPLDVIKSDYVELHLNIRNRQYKVVLTDNQSISRK